MNLDLVKSATSTVLSNISKDELAYNIDRKRKMKNQLFFRIVTLPALRIKVADAMKVSLDELLGKEVKIVILETFQDFLINNTKSKKTESESELIEEPIKKAKIEKKAESTKSNSNDDTAVSKAKPNKIVEISKDKIVSKPKLASPSVKSAQIEKLKSYVFKCGVRKNW